ncbi:CotH kinase family protein [Rufibacter immobilis]|uniref:CotH kinase family protein n=1 Tax=Rufibacter immobilis TaxID=1348778 RepID=UPI0035EB9B4A
MMLISNKKKVDYIGFWILVAFLIFIFTLVALFVGRNLDLEQKTSIQVSFEMPVPTFSHSSGFYNKEFLLSMSCKNPSAKIYFTLDGSTPTIHSFQYFKPFLVKDRTDEPNKLSEIKTAPVFKYPLYNVFKGVIIRAIAVVNDSVSSKDVSASFFVHSKGRNRYSLPVISLITDPDNIFGYKSGIYVMGSTADDKDYYLRNSLRIDNYKRGFPANYKRRGKNWYRPVALTFFDVDTNKGFATQAKVGIHGNASREQQHKSLKIIVESSGHVNDLIFPVFDKVRPDTISSFLLRSSSQDRYSTMFRDAILQNIFKGVVSLDIQDYRPLILFFNGEYWGIHNLRNRYDEFYFVHKYAIPADRVSVIGVKSNLGIEGELTMDQQLGRVIMGTEGDHKPYHDLLRYIKRHDLNHETHYAYVSQRMDVDNFIDYLLAEMYVVNLDWPHSNMQMWRYKVPIANNQFKFNKDGRWRWMLMDLDNGFLKGRYSYNMVEHVLRSHQLGPLFSSLLKNKLFRDKFFARADFHLATTFEVNRVLKKINRAQTQIAPEIKEHIERWRTHNSLEAWVSEVSSFKEFAQKRPIYFKEELKQLKSLYK